MDSIANATTVNVDDLTTTTDRWPEFAAAAAAAGYRAVHAIPLRLDGQAIGGLNLLHPAPRTLSDTEQLVGQTLADLAALGLAVDRQPYRRTERVAAHTLSVLNDRVAFGQAAGMVAQRLGIGPDEAKAVLYQEARDRRLPLREVLRAITAGELLPESLAGRGQSQSGSPTG